MGTGPAYTLTCDLTAILGGNPAALHVGVRLAQDRLVYAVGRTTGYPVSAWKVSDADGRASFNLLPSTAVGDYLLSVGSMSRTFAMPEHDARLSDLLGA